MEDKIILVDADGVLLDWEYAFNVYMQEHGFKKTEDGHLKYSIGKRYGIDSEQGKTLIKNFNESASIGFLPPLRDAMHYVKKLHEEHGFVFHCITSLSLNKNAQKLRKMNLEKLFGVTAFEEIICLDTGADKDDALKKYEGSNLYWVEDKYENCLSGLRVGLRPMLMIHGHNMDYEHDEVKPVRNWKEVYNIIVGQ
jgi:FMN phosphatase YigB (HAD superfamily)